jgi:hypothetical protein
MKNNYTQALLAILTCVLAFIFGVLVMENRNAKTKPPPAFELPAQREPERPMVSDRVFATISQRIEEVPFAEFASWVERHKWCRINSVAINSDAQSVLIVYEPVSR